jgi:CheY-like chemotaxis protein
MVLGQFELLRRPTTAGFGAKSGFAASAQLEDGRLVLIWDARALQIAFEASVVTADRTLDVREKAPVRRVLVVDDSIVVRDLIAEILSGAGYEVHTAENGRAALHVMDQNAPGLIVSDLEMPEMDGFQLLEAVRSRSATLPVILVTARSSTADRQRAASLGANAYVAKGEFEGSSLVNIVSRYYPGGP